MINSIEWWEGYPPEEKENKCLYCGEECEKTYCDKECKKAYEQEN